MLSWTRYAPACCSGDKSKVAPRPLSKWQLSTATTTTSADASASALQSRVRQLESEAQLKGNLAAMWWRKAEGGVDGVPGGIDYAMLFAVKHGWMKPLDEKKVNAAVNVWVREPALVCTATLGYIQLHEQRLALSSSARRPQIQPITFHPPSASAQRS